MSTTADSGFDHWSDYWSSGALTSLPQDFRSNYDGEVAEFWRARFAEHGGSARVLDVCTGNGPIAILAAAYARDHGLDWRVEAVDAAHPDVEIIAEHHGVDTDLIERIRFQGGTPIESLPYESKSFDLITSQYGLEYADLDQAAAELARVLSPGGILAFVHHAADSDMIRTMSAEAEDYRQLDGSGLLRIVRSWSRGQLADPDFPRRMEVPLRRLMQAARQSAQSPLLAQVCQSFGGLIQLPLATLRQQKSAAADFARQLESGRARLEDMLRVNRLIAEDSDWTSPLSDAGLTCRSTGDLVYRRQHRMGQFQIWSA
jgi:ubiquinone/menaquinone biosynthesis C-methylase UbiE